MVKGLGASKTQFPSEWPSKIDSGGIMANQPTWMGMAGSYEKNPGWYRSPQVGGGLQWNPQFGYQRRQDIEKGMASGKPMDQWGLKANTGQDWRSLFPGARTDAELKQMGLYNKATGNNLWKNYQTAGGWYDYGARPGQPQPGGLGPSPAPTPTPGTGQGPSIQPVGPPSAVPPGWGQQPQYPGYGWPSPWGQWGQQWGQQQPNPWQGYGFGGFGGQRGWGF